MSEVEQFLERARQSLAVVELLLSAGQNDVAASQTYYAAFYIATALFRARGQQFNRHSHLVAEYGRVFARSRQLDPAFHCLLRTIFNLRAHADYDPHPDTDARAVVSFTAVARDFLAAARTYLAANP
ncbi:MAG TPA: HEPN domain-containing protein [Tepidiformaceae bacterium]|nr:HEPN domain-containing protein [Tepidiformaceae bacterium]